MLVSVYLNDAATGSIWTREARAQTQQQVAMAVDWIGEQASDYGVTTRLYYDDGTENSPLCHTYSLQSRLRGGVDSEESNAFLDEMDAPVRHAGHRRPAGPVRHRPMWAFCCSCR